MVAWFHNELGAALCVADLEALGIPAIVSGALTSQWRADTPGWVRVHVHPRDEQRAREAIADLAAHAPSDAELEDQSTQSTEEDED